MCPTLKRITSGSIPVEVGGAGAGDLLLALGHVEEHGLVRLRPLEVKAFLNAVTYNRKNNRITTGFNPTGHIYSRQNKSESKGITEINTILMVSLPTVLLGTMDTITYYNPSSDI